MPRAWGNLLRARWTSAINGSNYRATSGFTAAGKNELGRAIQAWNRYLQLTPDRRSRAGHARRASVRRAWKLRRGVERVGGGDGVESRRTKGSSAWPSTPTPPVQTRKGDLAAAKALKLLPKVSQITTKLTLTQAKSSSTVARNIAAQC